MLSPTLLILAAVLKRDVLKQVAEAWRLLLADRREQGVAVAPEPGGQHPSPRRLN